MNECEWKTCLEHSNVLDGKASGTERRVAALVGHLLVFLAGIHVHMGN
jgi:hypothetical protein